jgi:hypothetical protein
MTELSRQSYTYELLTGRVAVLNAPFVCSEEDCVEALPAPLHPDPRAQSLEESCPRCGGRMYRAPFARARPRPRRDDTMATGSFGRIGPS